MLILVVCVAMLVATGFMFADSRRDPETWSVWPLGVVTVGAVLLVGISRLAS